MSYISIESVSFSYHDGTEVFRNFSLNVKKGDSVGIIGPNGAGKTTLLLAISGLVDFEGKIVVDGIEVNKKSVTDIRDKMSFVFQNPDDQLFMPTVEEDISFGLERIYKDNDKISDVVKKSLEQAEIPGFEERSSHHLSLGQKKRVCLAAAFARNSEILLLDEPTNELDPKSRREFMELIKRRGVTKLIVSHDLNMITELCSKVALIDNKKVIASGDAKNILSDEKLMLEHSLEVPLLLKQNR